MHPTGIATAQCLLFINQGEQREASHFVALAKEKDLKRKEDNRFSWEYNRAHLICSLFFFFSYSQKDHSILEKNALKIMLIVTLGKYSKYYKRLLDIIK